MSRNPIKKPLISSVLARALGLLAHVEVMSVSLRKSWTWTGKFSGEPETQPVAEFLVNLSIRPSSVCDWTSSELLIVMYSLYVGVKGTHHQGRCRCRHN